ncbi:conserved hypothetical protein [Afipia carboxidovorans OM5]|uniref:Uncharacterized protein n=1 Tax=Afipia carboxidovorans (strain ATCC 49405 / DSM 1227 / KCTC 32145 / OM5) TaxID=504832 RepID=B6JJE9_AFIC5|nr:hypothetical protein [Afipia carboxidovorans]ACI94543.1 conserved hypothetical protein [Afipia carboxidovorans OM5]AEI01840.1 hypothetical protein OCA4_c06910 [Afipia carboxidovorans OM4]AEI05415.1 hypothetical protein OCA5_c06920 [Afipia carboxidovorans OM5]
MIKATFLASAAAALALAATPALAKDNTRAHAPTAKSQKLRHSSAHHATPHHRMKRHERVSRMDRGSDWDRGNWNRRSGFWPADTAAGIAGGAVNTAGAIATGAIGTAGAIASAPFRGPYYDNDYYVDQRPYGMAYTPEPYASPRYRYGNTYASVDDDFGGYVGGSYDYSGTVIPGSPDYAARNGFSCRPGSLIKMNGQTTVCQ